MLPAYESPEKHTREVRRELSVTSTVRENLSETSEIMRRVTRTGDAALPDYFAAASIQVGHRSRSSSQQIVP